MRINFRFLPGSRSRVAVVIVLAFVVIAARVSAHRVIGQNYPTMATALIQSPTASPTDLPIPIYSTGLSVICVRVTNTSVVDARIAAIGLELPGTRAGFALLTPLDLGMRVYENVGSVPGFPGVTLDLVLAAAVPGSTLGGIPRSTTPTQFASADRSTRPCPSKRCSMACSCCLTAARRFAGSATSACGSADRGRDASTIRLSTWGVVVTPQESTTALLKRQAE
jgi:hypothetical protein